MWVRILKNNIIYAIGSVANSGALFLLIPFLVNNLSADEFGAWSIYEIIVLLLGILISAGMDIGLMRQYWFLEDDQERSILSGTVLIAATLWGIALFGVLIICYWYIKSTPLFTVFHLNVFPTISLILVYLIGYTESLFTILLAVFRIREQAIFFVSLTIGKMIFFLGGAILGEKIIGNINGVLLGRLMAAIAGIIASGFLVYKNMILRFDTNHLKRVLSYGLPLIPANLSTYVLISSDRYILNATSTLAVIAAYSFAYKIASALDILINRPFATDWAARRFKLAAQENPQSRYADIFVLFYFISSLAVAGLIAFSPMLYKIIAPSIYLDAIKVLPVLVFAIQIYGLSYPLNVGLVIKDMTSTVAVVGIISAVFCISIELWLIPHYGIVGAAWSTLLSYIVWTAGITILSLRVYPIRYNLKKISMIFTTSIVAYIGLNWILKSLSDASIRSLLLSLGWLVLIYGITGYTLIRKSLFKDAAKA